jgi:V/A-type H+-transporting ATPase subunit D
VAIKFQYNKISLQQLDKHLKMRERALPTLKNKESALRMEVKRARDKARTLDKELQQMVSQYDNMVRMWGEFDSSLVTIDDVDLEIKKIAGVHTPVLKKVHLLRSSMG